MKEKPFRVWSYCRVSSGPQERSLDWQIDEAKKKAVELVEHGGVVEKDWCFEEIESATDVRYTERPVFAALMQRIEKGDHLIIASQNRLDRDEIACLNCLRWLSDMDVTLHETDSGTSGPVMKTLNDRLLRLLYAMNGAMTSETNSLKVKAALKYRRDNGFCAHRTAPWGKKKKTLRKKEGQQHPYKILVWDQHQCDLLREIKLRRDRGESLLSIARDLHERGERTQNGGRWLLRCKKRINGNPAPVCLAYHWYNKLLKSGKDLGDVPLVNSAASSGGITAEPFPPPAARASAS